MVSANISTVPAGIGLLPYKKVGCGLLITILGQPLGCISQRLLIIEHRMLCIYLPEATPTLDPFAPTTHPLLPTNNEPCAPP
jgi:hypothetical protein